MTSRRTIHSVVGQKSSSQVLDPASGSRRRKHQRGPKHSSRLSNPQLQQTFDHLANLLPVYVVDHLGNGHPQAITFIDQATC